MSEPHRVYEAIQQDNPVVPMKTNLGSDELMPNMVTQASQNPYAAALHKNFYSEFQEEPVAALNEADISWSIPTTHVQYKKAAEYSCFKPMNHSPLFQIFKQSNFSETDCVEDVSSEHFEHVSCELNHSSNFEEHVNVMTTYLIGGRQRATCQKGYMTEQNIYIEFQK